MATNRISDRKDFFMSNDDKSLAHTRWNCKVHIVFTPKYRRKVIYGKLRVSIGQILRKLCEMKDVEIIEAHAMPDHIHIYRQRLVFLILWAT